MLDSGYRLRIRSQVSTVLDTEERPMNQVTYTEEDQQAAREYLEAKSRLDAVLAEERAYSLWLQAEPPTPMTRRGRFPLACSM
jgi:hypothetical protein